jgi:hypothetical protein
VHRRTRTTAAIVLVAAALGGAACGGDDDDSDAASTTTETTAGEALSQADFVEQANAICGDVNDQVSGLFTADPTQLSEDEQADVVNQLVDITRDGADQLEALTPPEDIADDYADVLQAIRDDADVVEQQGADFFANEDDPFADVNTRFSDLGLDVCATDGDDSGDGSDQGASGESVDVTAVDYRYQDLPSTIAAGTAINFINASTDEVHEMVVLKVPDGETRSVDELMALPEDQLDALFPEDQPPATVIVAPPGGDPVFAFDDGGVISDPGRYIVICAIPTGADPVAYFDPANQTPDGPPNVEGGPPHFTQGMFGEFTVTE